MGTTNRTRTKTTTLIPVDGKLLPVRAAANASRRQPDPGGGQPYEPIGLGKPLIVTIEWCYLGDYRGPRTSAPLLLASTVKDISQFSGQPCAVNFVSSKHAQKSPVEFPAHTDGTRIVYYSTSMDKTRFDFTIELATNQFNKAFADSLADLMGKAGALPVFSIGAQAALVAGSQIFKIANSVAKGVLDGESYFDVTQTLAFDVADHLVPEAGRRYLFREFDAVEAKRILIDKGAPGDFQLYDKITDKVYRGDIPYVAITLDGRKNANLADWKATAATSDQLSQFLNGAQTDKVQIVNEIAGGLKYFGDLQTGKKIRAARRHSRTSTRSRRSTRSWRHESSP